MKALSRYLGRESTATANRDSAQQAGAHLGARPICRYTRVEAPHRRNRRGVLSIPLKTLMFTGCGPLKPQFRLLPFETTVGLRLEARICRNPACACRAAVTCRASQRAQIVRPRRKFGEVPDDLIANHEPCGARTIEPGSAPTSRGALSSKRPPNCTPKIVAGKPVRGNARCAREPFPAARSVSTTTSASNGGSGFFK